MSMLIPKSPLTSCLVSILILFNSQKVYKVGGRERKRTLRKRKAKEIEKERKRMKERKTGVWSVAGSALSPGPFIHSTQLKLQTAP